jgi:uncharacterized protein (DUF488 family)
MGKGEPRSGPALWTVGHSNHPLEKFLGILRSHGVRQVLDVRRFPTSRKWPHFDAAALTASLGVAGIGYLSLPELGGRRPSRPDSPHTAWRNEAFRGYADFMETPEFAEAFERAAGLAREDPSAILCAEAVPWRCHRALLADAFLARGWSVEDILSESESRPHRLPPFARVEGTRVIYDGGELPFDGEVR